MSPPPREMFVCISMWKSHLTETCSISVWIDQRASLTAIAAESRIHVPFEVGEKVSMELVPFLLKTPHDEATFRTSDLLMLLHAI